MALIEHTAPGMNLTGAFENGPGYFGATWVEVTDDGEFTTDRAVPVALASFLGEVAQMVKENGSQVIGRIGCAYTRVIDGASPENYMKWHVDNEDGGNRFHTAISTDGARVNLAWPEDASVVGQRVEDTDWESAYQPDNGAIVGFTTEPHGVLPQRERPGEATAIFFATLYKDRNAANLYVTNNTTTSLHATLPTLEGSRYS